jgi:hypothetical protein
MPSQRRNTRKLSVNSMRIEYINPLNAKLNPICHVLVLLGAHHIFHVSRIRFKYGVGTILF